MGSFWHIDISKSLDIICMGRVAVDLYSEQVGSSLEDTLTFKKYLGGCAGNIAVGTSRLGLRSSMFSCVGTDAMGLFLKNELSKENVDISMLRETKHHLTGLVLLGINPPDRFPLIFYRQNCADMQLSPQDVNADYIAKSKTLLITGTGLSTESMRSATYSAIDAANSVNTKVIFDLDYRPVLWGLTEQGDGESRYQVSKTVSKEYQRILSSCHLIVGTEEEVRIAGGSDSVTESLYNIRTYTSAPIVLKKGEQGCCVYLNDLDKPITSTPFPVDVLNVLGAGDAFISGFLRGLLRNEPWDVCAKYGNACGAIMVTRHGCAPMMPTFDEMQLFISEYEVKGLHDARLSYS